MKTTILIAALTLLTLLTNAQCSISFSQTDLWCNGMCIGSVTAIPTGTSPFTYSWSNGDTTATTDSLCAGTYILTLTDALACIAIDSITITEPPALVATLTWVSNPSAPAMCDGEISLSVSGGTIPYNLQWVDCTTWLLLSPTLPPYNNLCDGEYACIVTDANGCIDTSNCVTITDPPAAITESANTATFSIYPNPSNDYFTVMYSGDIGDGVEINLYDITGRRVKQIYSGKRIEARQPMKFSCKQFSSGLYFITLKTNDKQLTRKLVVSH